MELAIIGFPQSGKSTLFQALTGGKGESGGKRTRGALGVVKVPDPRLEALAAVFTPKKITPAEITYIDIPGAVAGLGKGKGIEGQFLEELSRVDAFVHVVGAFADGEGAALDGGRIREVIASMDMELAFSDLALIERRLQRVEGAMKSQKPAEREAAHREHGLLTRLKAGLESETPVRDQAVNAEERAILQNFQLLTSKPLMVVLNIAEGQIKDSSRLEGESRKAARRDAPIVAVCGKFEAELAQLEEGEAKAFMEDAGIKESSLRRMVHLSYQVLGLVTFFTAGPQEVRAWTIRKDTAAPKAAGKVHSDMERGFIRAEVIALKDLLECGGFAEARKRGLLRMEGKGYIVQEADVVTFLFNV